MEAWNCFLEAMGRPLTEEMVENITKRARTLIALDRVYTLVISILLAGSIGFFLIEDVKSAGWMLTVSVIVLAVYTAFLVVMRYRGGKSTRGDGVSLFTSGLFIGFVNILRTIAQHRSDSIADTAWSVLAIAFLVIWVLAYLYADGSLKRQK